MQRRLTNLVALAPLLCWTGGCGATETQRPASRVVVIDEIRGAMGEVRLGQSESDLRRILGKPARTGDAIPPGTAELEDIGVPWLVVPPATKRRGDPIPTTLAYPHLVVMTTRRSGIYYLSTTANEARTSRGVEVGDTLATAQAKYSALHCDTRNRNTELRAYRLLHDAARPSPFHLVRPRPDQEHHGELDASGLRAGCRRLSSSACLACI